VFKVFLNSPKDIEERLNKTARNGISILRDEELPLSRPDVATQKGNARLSLSLKPIPPGVISR